MSLEQVSRYDRRRVSEMGNEAIVIGGSMAGLMAARVLDDAFDEVVVIERDQLPTEPEPRPGVPQSTQPHILRMPIKVVLEDLFPGYGEQLVSNGGIKFDASKDMQTFAAGEYINGTSFCPVHSASRPLVEHVVRRQIRTFDSIRIMENCHFIDYLWGEEQERVTGVKVKHGEREECEMVADLVVDATGKTSRTPRLIEKRGYDRPPVDERQIDGAYTSMLVNRPPDDRRHLLIPFSPPDRTAAGGAIPIEDDRFLVAVGGLYEEYPAADLEECMEFAADLPSSEIRQILEQYDIVDGSLEHYPFPSSMLRRYELLDEFPERLVVIGDAIASLNPAYGRGLSVAAMEAVQLHQCLSEGLEGISRRYFDQIEPIVSESWSVTARDLLFPQSSEEQSTTSKVIDKYIDLLKDAASDDPMIADEYMRVSLMEKSPKALYRPVIAWRVLRNQAIPY